MSSPKVKFDIHRLVEDLGGPSRIAAIIGCSRSLPYRWLNSGSMTTASACRLLEARKEFGIDFDLSDYFVEA